MPHSLKNSSRSISIHAPRKGERQKRHSVCSGNGDFNPRSPQGGATAIVLLIRSTHRFQSTLPARGSDCARVCGGQPDKIFQSTLPARGSDFILFCCGTANANISIHAPRKGERPAAFSAAAFSDKNFNPRSPQGGATRKPFFDDISIAYISIHAPRKGERQRKSAFVCSISANLLNIIHCGTVTRAVSRRRIALFRLFSVRRSGVFMYAYASH